MAITTLTATAFGFNDDPGVEMTPGAGDAINVANTMRVLYPKHGKLLIVVDSDNAATAPTFKAGGQGSGGFMGAGQGDLTVTAIADTKMRGFILDSDRFKDMDGYVYFTWAASSAGFVKCYTIPGQS